MMLSPVSAKVAMMPPVPKPPPAPPTAAEEAAAEAAAKKRLTKETRDNLAGEQARQNARELRNKVHQRQQHSAKIRKKHDANVQAKMEEKATVRPHNGSPKRQPKITDCYEAMARLERTNQMKDDKEQKRSSDLAADMSRREVRVIEAYYSAKSVPVNALYAYLERKGEAHRFEEISALQAAALASVEENRLKKVTAANVAEAKRAEAIMKHDAEAAQRLKEFAQRNEERLLKGELQGMDRYERRQKELTSKVMKKMEGNGEPRPVPTFSAVEIRAPPPMTEAEIERRRAKEEDIKQKLEAAEANRMTEKREAQRVYHEHLGAVLQKKIEQDTHVVAKLLNLA